MLKCFRFSLSNRPPFPQAPDGPSAAFKWSSRPTASKSPLRGFKVRWFQVLGEGRASARPRPPAGQHGARGGTGTRRVVLRLACALLHPPHPDGPARDVPAPPRRGASARTPHGEPPHNATRRGGAGTSRADTPYANPNCSEAKSRGPCLPTPYNAFFALKHPVPLFFNAKDARNSDAKDATCCDQGMGGQRRGGRDKRVPPVADQRQLRPSTVTIRSATAPHTNPEARWLLTTFPVLLFYSRGNETAPTVPF